MNLLDNLGLSVKLRLLLLLQISASLAAGTTSVRLFRAAPTAALIDAESASARTRLECGSRCLAVDTGCLGFAFRGGVCQLARRVNFTADAAAAAEPVFVTEIASAADVSISAGTNTSPSASTTISTGTSFSISSSTVSTTTASPSPWKVWSGIPGKNFVDGRTKCREMGYVDLVSYDNFLGGSPRANEFILVNDQFKGYTFYSLYLMGARYNSSLGKFEWVSKLGSFAPADLTWAAGAQNLSVECVTVDRVEPYFLRSVDCATPVEAVLCELV